MPPARLRLGELLVEAGIIDEAELEGALARQKADGRRLGTLLVESGLVNETQLTQILSQQLNAPWVSLYHIDFSRQLLSRVPRDIVEKYCLVPIYVRHVRGQGDTLYVAMDDPSNDEALKACAASSTLPVRAMIAPPSDIRNAIRVYYSGRASQPSIPEMLPAKPTGSEPVIVEPRPLAPPPGVPELPPIGDEIIEITPDPPAVVAPPPSRPQPSDQPPATHRSAPPTAAAQIADATPASQRPPASERPSAPSPPRSEPAPASTAAPARPQRKRPRTISLTLLDGTTISVPARKKVAEGEPPPSTDEDEMLTARDLIAALRAVSHGADASEILGTARWETLFAALLSLLMKKHLIADWEFIEEFKKI